MSAYGGEPVDRLDRLAAFVQPFTTELMAKAHILAGSRVIVLNSGVGDVALLAAERVGSSGSVIGFEEDHHLREIATMRAQEQWFRHVTFRALHEIDSPPVLADMVIARFYLAQQADQTGAIRRVASMVHPGGRLIFQEWHFDSMEWSATSSYPRFDSYRTFAELLLQAMRSAGIRTGTGLELTNAFAAAGLALPATYTSLDVIKDSSTSGYTFFEDLARQSLRALEHAGTAPSKTADLFKSVRQIQRDIKASGGHAFLPLQVGALGRA